MNSSSKWFAAALGCALGGLGPSLVTPIASSDATLASKPSASKNQKSRDDIAAQARERAVWLHKLQAELNPTFPRELTTPMPIAADNNPTHTTFHPTHSTNLENPSAKTLEQTDLSSRKLLRALTKALGNHTPQVMRHVNTHNDDILPSSTGSPFAVQVATFPSLALARRLQQELTRKGHPAAVVRGYSDSVHEGNGKPIVYHVRLHGFTSRAKAEQYRLRFQQQEPRLTTFCVKQGP